MKRERVGREGEGMRESGERRGGDERVGREGEGMRESGERRGGDEREWGEKGRG